MVKFWLYRYLWIRALRKYRVNSDQEKTAWTKLRVYLEKKEEKGRPSTESSESILID